MSHTCYLASAERKQLQLRASPNAAGNPTRRKSVETRIKLSHRKFQFWTPGPLPDYNNATMHTTTQIS